ARGPNKKAKRAGAKNHLTSARQRRDCHLKTARQYAQRDRRSSVEDLHVAGAGRPHPRAPSPLHAPRTPLLAILTETPDSARHAVTGALRRFTTQRCSGAAGAATRCRRAFPSGRLSALPAASSKTAT